MKNKKRKKTNKLVFIAIFGLLGLIGSVVLAIVWVNQLPGILVLSKQNPEQTAFMVYRAESGVEGAPIWRSIENIAEELRHAVIVAEDAEFNRHHGVDWNALWDAQKRNFKERRLYRGGSTITQQLAKNLYLRPSKTVLRKYKELFIAIRLEQLLSKLRIMEIYLNVIEWGSGIYGAEAAARHYFEKSAAELNIDEATWLAAILPSPLRFEKNRNSEYIQKRANWIKGFVERRMKIN